MTTTYDDTICPACDEPVDPDLPDAHYDGGWWHYDHFLEVLAADEEEAAIVEAAEALKWPWKRPVETDGEEAK